MIDERVKVGDVICCKGYKLEIKKIYYACYSEFEDKSWMIEFESQYGIGYWKQYCDGGILTRNGKEVIVE